MKQNRVTALFEYCDEYFKSVSIFIVLMKSLSQILARERTRYSNAKHLLLFLIPASDWIKVATKVVPL